MMDRLARLKQHGFKQQQQQQRRVVVSTSQKSHHHRILSPAPSATPCAENAPSTSGSNLRQPRVSSSSKLGLRDSLERLYSWPPEAWSETSTSSSASSSPPLLLPVFVTLPDGSNDPLRIATGGQGLAAGLAAAAPAPFLPPPLPPHVLLAAQQQQQQEAPPSSAPQQPSPGNGDNGGGDGSGPSGRPPPGERSQDYYANVGDAIRTLREDIPQLFDRELNFSIYRDDIVFRDPRNSFAGIKNYRTIFWSLRFHGRIFFKKLYVEVKRIWQAEDNAIRMRWTVHGVPRVPWEAEGTFDGISQYKLDNEGRIYEHAVDNVILRDPPVGVLPWLYSINLTPARQQAVPGAFFLPSSGSGSSAAEAAAAAAAAAASAAPHQQQQEQQAPPPRSAAASAAAAAAAAWLAPLLARFSFVRLYAAMLATTRLLQRQRERLAALAGGGAGPAAACGERC